MTGENITVADGALDEKTRRLLGDLLRHTDATARLVGRGKPAFDADEFLRYAGEDLLVRMGEVVVRLDRTSPGFVEAHPGLELRNLKDTRNVMAHGYDIVDFEIVWEILSVHLPPVAKKVRSLLPTNIGELVPRESPHG